MSAGLRSRATVVVAVVVSVSLHFAAAGVLVSQIEEPVPGALAAGEAGLEIGLGSVGSNQLVQHSIKEEPEVDADTGKPADAEVSSPRAEAEKLVKETAPVVEPKPEPKPKPAPKPTPESRPKPKPEPELESNPAPASAPEPRPETVAEPIVPVAANTTSTSADISNPATTEGRPRLARASTAGSGAASDRSRGGKKGDPNHYFSLLMAALNDAKRYPVESKKRKEEGVVTVAMEIERNGVITASSVSRSSGHPRLDRAALEMLARASPLPPVPDFIEQDPLKIIIPIEFSLITNSF